MLFGWVRAWCIKRTCWSRFHWLVRADSSLLFAHADDLSIRGKYWACDQPQRPPHSYARDRPCSPMEHHSRAVGRGRLARCRSIACLASAMRALSDVRAQPTISRFLWFAQSLLDCRAEPVMLPLWSSFAWLDLYSRCRLMGGLGREIVGHSALQCSRCRRVSASEKRGYCCSGVSDTRTALPSRRCDRHKEPVACANGLNEAAHPLKPYLTPWFQIAIINLRT